MQLRINSLEIRRDSLLWVISGVSKYTRINSTFYAVMADDDNSIYHSMDKVVVKDVLPDGLDELASAVSHKLAMLGVPVRVPA